MIKPPRAAWQTLLGPVLGSVDGLALEGWRRKEGKKKKGKRKGGRKDGRERMEKKRKEEERKGGKKDRWYLCCGVGEISLGLSPSWRGIFVRAPNAGLATNRVSRTCGD